MSESSASTADRVAQAYRQLVQDNLAALEAGSQAAIAIAASKLWAQGAQTLQREAESALKRLPEYASKRAALLAELAESIVPAAQRGKATPQDALDRLWKHDQAMQQELAEAVARVREQGSAILEGLTAPSGDLLSAYRRSLESVIGYGKAVLQESLAYTKAAN